MKHESIHSITRRILKEAGGSRVKATEALLKYVSTRDSLTAEVMRIGVSKLLSEVTLNDRAALHREFKAISTAPARGRAQPFVKSPYQMSPAEKEAQQRKAGLGSTIRNAVLDSPYEIDGFVKPLREWTGVVVEDYGHRCLTSATTAVRNARFAIMVGAAAGDRPIGEVLTIDSVEEMRRDADLSDV